jgi:hypothetical protein
VFPSPLVPVPFDVRFSVADPAFAPAVEVFNAAVIPVLLDPAVTSENDPAITGFPVTLVNAPSNFSEKASLATLFCTEYATGATTSPTCTFPKLIAELVTAPAAYRNTAPLEETPTGVSVVFPNPLVPVPFEVNVIDAVPVLFPALDVSSIALIAVDDVFGFNAEKLPEITMLPEGVATAPSSFSENPSAAVLFKIEYVIAGTTSPTCRFPNASGFPVTLGSAYRNTLPVAVKLTAVSAVFPSPLVPVPFDVKFSVALPDFAPAVDVSKVALIPVLVDCGDNNDTDPPITIFPDTPVSPASNFSENVLFGALFFNE